MCSGELFCHGFSYYMHWVVVVETSSASWTTGLALSYSSSISKCTWTFSPYFSLFVDWFLPIKKSEKIAFCIKISWKLFFCCCNVLSLIKQSKRLIRQSRSHPQYGIAYALNYLKNPNHKFSKINQFCNSYSKLFSSFRNYFFLNCKARV